MSFDLHFRFKSLSLVRGKEKEGRENIQRKEKVKEKKEVGSFIVFVMIEGKKMGDQVNGCFTNLLTLF